MAIERFMVQSFDKMKGHPDQNLGLVEEEYFNTIEECKRWCRNHFDIKNINFEIHHSIGAKTYLFAMGTGTGVMNWIEKDYEVETMPSVKPWWKISDLPEGLDQLCMAEKF